MFQHLRKLSTVTNHLLSPHHSEVLTKSTAISQLLSQETINYRNIGTKTKEALGGLNKFRWSEMSINNVYTHTAVLSMPGHFCKWWAPKFTASMPASSQVQVTAALVCAAVWASTQSCDTSLETGFKAGKSHGHKVSLPPLPERKIPGGWGPAGTRTAQNTRESAWGCRLIFTLREKKISCHLTLHFEHLQTNATSAGYLPSAASALPHGLSVSFSRSATSVKRPLWKPPHFLIPLRAFGKWMCDTGAKSSAANLPHPSQPPAAAKLKIAATGKPGWRWECLFLYCRMIMVSLLTCLGSERSTNKEMDKIIKAE